MFKRKEKEKDEIVIEKKTGFFSRKPKDPKEPKQKQKKEPKKKSDEYIVGKNFTMKILRAIFWIMISFIFVKGIVSSLRPDRADQVGNMIKDFRQEFNTQEGANEEILGFAQNFIKEYLTYEKSGENDFRDRIKPYVTGKTINANTAYDFKHAAKAVYVGAYRKVEYAKNQYDVYVLAEILYINEILNEETGLYEEVRTYKTSNLKVPIYSSEAGYTIEGLPLFVTDNLLDSSYVGAEYYPGSELDNAKIKPAISNFLTAYYSQEQSIIDYYLTADADKSKFLSLDNRYEFDRIESIKCYQKEGSQEITCILKIKIKDTVNDSTIGQEFNVIVIEDGDRIYIKDLNTKIVNIK